MSKLKMLLPVIGSLVTLLLLASACRFPGLRQPAAQATLEVPALAVLNPTPSPTAVDLIGAAAPGATAALVPVPEGFTETPAPPSATASPVDTFMPTLTPQPPTPTDTSQPPTPTDTPRPPTPSYTSQPPAPAGANQPPAEAFSFQELIFIIIPPYYGTPTVSPRPWPGIYVQPAVGDKQTDPGGYLPGGTLIVQGYNFPAGINLPVGLYHVLGVRCKPVDGAIAYTNRQGSFSLAFLLSPSLSPGQYAVVPIQDASQTTTGLSAVFTLGKPKPSSGQVTLAPSSTPQKKRLIMPTPWAPVHKITLPPPKIPLKPTPTRGK